MKDSYKMAISTALDELTEELYSKHVNHLEEVTRGQLRDLIGQIIKCGDIRRYSCVEPYGQRMEYIPFRREQELLERIWVLEEEVKQVRFYTRQ